MKEWGIPAIHGFALGLAVTVPWVLLLTQTGCR